MGFVLASLAYGAEGSKPRGQRPQWVEPWRRFWICSWTSAGSERR